MNMSGGRRVSKAYKYIKRRDTMGEKNKSKNTAENPLDIKISMVLHVQNFINLRLLL